MGKCFTIAFAPIFISVIRHGCTLWILRTAANRTPRAPPNLKPVGPWPFLSIHAHRRAEEIGTVSMRVDGRLIDLFSSTSADDDGISFQLMVPPSRTPTKRPRQKGRPMSPGSPELLDTESPTARVAHAARHRADTPELTMTLDTHFSTLKVRTQAQPQHNSMSRGVF